MSTEGLVGFAAGAMYGATSLMVGHPFDTLKTKMQAQHIHSKAGSWEVLLRTVRTEGVVGLYRGCVPPLLGSSILRSTQFGVYESVMHIFNKYNTPSIYIGPINMMIFFSGLCSGAARAALECPLEVCKVRLQVGSAWEFKSLFNGFEVNLARNMGLLASFFVMVDIVDNNTNLSPLVGALFKGSVCATVSWWIVFPLDVAKSKIQGQITNKPPGMTKALHQIYITDGIRGLWRGVGPGTIRSIIANGISLVVYTKMKNVLFDWIDS